MFQLGQLWSLVSGTGGLLSSSRICSPDKVRIQGDTTEMLPLSETRAW